MLLELVMGSAFTAQVASAGGTARFPRNGVIKVGPRGRLPAGRYGSLVHRGPYEELYDANAVLIGWAKERGIRWDAEETEAGERFGCRLEIYRTDPREEPDPAKRETEVAIRIADAVGGAAKRGEEGPPGLAEGEPEDRLRPDRDTETRP